jgi:hypothetical protein
MSYRSSFQGDIGQFVLIIEPSEVSLLVDAAKYAPSRGNISMQHMHLQCLPENEWTVDGS